MKKFGRPLGLAPEYAGEAVKCEKCGATTRLDTGVCVSCLLREGLEAGGEVSRAVYEIVLAEVDAPNKQWHLGNYEMARHLLSATNRESVCTLWQKSRALSNTPMAGEFSIAISNQETSCSMTAANHW